MIRTAAASLALSCLWLGCVATASEDERPRPAEESSGPARGVHPVGLSHRSPGGGERRATSGAAAGNAATSGPAEAEGGPSEAERPTGGPGEASPPMLPFGGGSGVGTGRVGSGIPGASGLGATGVGGGTGNIPYAPPSGLSGIGDTTVGTGRNTGGGIPGAAGLGASGTGPPSASGMNGASTTNPPGDRSAERAGGETIIVIEIR